MSQNKPTHHYLIYDFETGGLSSKENAACEIAMIAVRADNFEEVGRISKYIRPYDQKGNDVEYDLVNHLSLDIKTKDQKEVKDQKKEFNDALKSVYDFIYTDGAMSVHNIDPSEIYQGSNVKDLVNEIIELGNKIKVNNTSGKSVLVAHNADFDRNFMQQIFEVSGKTKEMSKIFSGKEDHYGNFQPHSIDTIDIARMMWHKNDEEIARYSMDACAEKLNIDLVGSHRAINDTVALKDVFLSFKKSIRSKSTQGEDEENRFRDKFKIKFEY